MDKAKVTMRKGSKPKTKKDSPEVFVLPPNLLEKLGIHLGNLGSAPENTVGSPITDSSLISKENESGVKKISCKNHSDSHVSTSSEIESSIIETAELMTTSVFLSPTFISNNASNIQGQIEIVGNAEAPAVKISDRPLNNECSTKTTEDLSIEINKGHGPISNVVTSSNNENSFFNQEILHHDQIANGNVEMNNVQMQTLVDDHADEAYSSDCSNSNIGCNIKSALKLNQHKINIISEQIILPSQFYNLKSNYSPKGTSLIPVSMNTKIHNHSFIQNSIHHNDLDLIPHAAAGNIVPAEITVVSVDDMHGPLFVEGETNIPIEGSETLHNINKMDICAVLNEGETELITTQSQEFFQQDFEGLRNHNKDDMIPNDGFEEDTDVPCLIDTMSERSDDFSTLIQDKSEQSDDVLKETFDKNKTGELKDDINFISEYSEHSDKVLRKAFEKSDVSNGDKLLSETVPSESKSGVIVEDNKLSSTSFIIRPANDSKNMIESKHTYMTGNSKTEDIADRFPYQELLPTNRELTTPKDNNAEVPSTLQKSETDLIDHEKGNNTLVNEEIDQSVLGNSHDSVSNARCSGDSSQTQQNKLVITMSSRPIFYVKCHKEPVRQNNEIVEGQCKHQDVYENREPGETKINKCNTRENKILKVEHINKPSVGQDDKIREIAKYLSEFADMKKRSHFLKKNMTTSAKTMRNKKGTTCTKSSIQGVEKPGGSELNKREKHYPPMKTYGRRSIPSRKTIPSYISKESASTESISLTDSTSNNFCYDMEECLCYDFGRLKCYEDVSSYEHIHFWNKAKPICTPEIIFNIYNEDAPAVAVDSEVINVIEECSNETSHETVHKLCWNELKLINDNSFDENDLRTELEHDKTYLFITEKNANKEECNEKKEAEKVVVCQNDTMINVNLLQTQNNNNVVDDYSAKTGQKRKRSVVLSDDVEPPAKNSKHTLSKRLSQTKEEPANIDAKHIITTAVETCPTNASPLETPCTPSAQNPIISAEQACTFSSKTSPKLSSTAPFLDIAVPEQQQAEKYLPANGSMIKCIDQPSESLNSLESQTKIPEKAVTTNQNSRNENNVITCAVCQQSVERADWINHIASQHNYLAWQCGEPSLDVDDETAVREHLYGITKICGGLTCAKCGLARKYVKAYLSHVRDCTGLSEKPLDVTPTVTSEHINDGSVKCGVCDETILSTDWNDHRASRHDYLSWILGEPPLDVNDEAAVRHHLCEIAKVCGGLTCAKCGLTRKYAKAYLSHIRNCTGLSESQNDSAYDVSTEMIPRVESAGIKAIGENDTKSVDAGSVQCGVCYKSVELKDWIHHIASEHDYLAWKLGDEPLDINDDAAIRVHLYDITKTCGGLTCAKCGLTRKYVKAYLSHVKKCDGLNQSQNDSTCNVSSDKAKLPTLVNGSLSNVAIENDKAATSTAVIQCAVCDESMQEENWNSHIAARHDYLAWKLGDAALDVYDETAVRDHLYEITKASRGLTCAKCGLTRKYVKSYLTHVKQCNGPDSSQNDSLCNISADASLGMESNELASDSIVKVKQENAPKKAVQVTCAVCEETVQEVDWYIHIASRHDYLAWKSDEPRLDIGDESAVQNHLYTITKACGGLKCSKCGLCRKYVKAYLSHFKNCNGPSESQNDNSVSMEVSVDSAEPASSSTNEVNEEQLKVKCAVCAQCVLEINWNSHIASQHGYLAWKDGEKCLDIEDEDAVRQHLHLINKQTGGLTCSKCGTNKTSVNSYLNHVQSCESTSSDLEESTQDVVLETRASATEGQTLTSPQADRSLVKCGVCGQEVAHNDWTQHIAASHGYIAWRDDQPPLDQNNEKEVRVHLNSIIKELGILKCPKCDVPHMNVKSYLQHIEICKENQEDMKNSFKCGACNEMVIGLYWEKHLSEKHGYLAWKDGETPVNVDDEESVQEHLYNFTKQFGSLFCHHCGLRRKYVKSYLEHVKICKNGVPEVAPDELVVDFTSCGTCAVCHKDIEAGKWIQHTQREHNYLAWREGETPWNLDDFDDLNQYLYVINKKMNGLTCNKCGIVRKYVKTYLTHIKSCDVTDFNLGSSVAEGVGPLNKDDVQCAMCKEQMKRSNWKTHAMESHYNISWIIGETPIDIKNPYAVERYLKEYKQVYGRLKCNVCKTSRASFAGFYAHIIICGKSEEEIDLFRCVCEICNNKYLCIYKNQHAMIHRVQEYTAEQKLKKAENNLISNEEPNLSGKRRAAVKARTVIENYSDNMSTHAHSCKSCGFGTDFEDELKAHKCEVSNEKDFSGDESSAAEIESSGDESEDTDVDSNISNEANDDDDDDEADEGGHEVKKKRYRESAPVLPKVSRIPFKVDEPATYLREGDDDYCKTFLTDETLFPQWQCHLEAVSESEITRYLPPLMQSCKFKNTSGWKTLNRFEAEKEDRVTSIFVGASIVCVAWAPLRVEDLSDGSTNFLAVACHNGPDCPRYRGAETPKHENLIQIWNFSKFERLPQVVLGIAHEFGTVWSMEWCPSGARAAPPAADALPPAAGAPPPAAGAPRRLGLLAVACSGGSAYIFAVPYPSTDEQKDDFVYKIKPVAELRMTMGSERKRYQATSVSWSQQKGHATVLVGYADGSTAYYDLHSTSPLLLTIENDMQVFHPYNEERPHNTCITGTDLYPVAGDAGGAGAGAWSAPTGAELAPRAGAGAGAAGRARLATAALACKFAPHACCAVLGGDDAIMYTAISELVWVPPGRRLGGVRAAAGCARCGRVVASAPPALRVLRLHPAYGDCKKQVVGLLEMTHLAKKRKKQVNDDLAMVIEPLTYEDAITKYGITFKIITRTDRATQQEHSSKPRAQCPERFPLGDVKSMAFCPSRKYHEKLAVATHSGILFLMTVH